MEKPSVFIPKIAWNEYKQSWDAWVEERDPDTFEVAWAEYVEDCPTPGTAAQAAADRWKQLVLLGAPRRIS